MADEADFGAQFWQPYDFFRVEAESFERDVHILILGTLHASTTYLNEEAKREEVELLKHLETATGHAAERISERHAELWSGVAEQERFQRNMALVALLTRLTHAFRQVSRSAELWSVRDPAGYGERKDDEFKKLWAEYRARFDIDFGARHIQFVEPLRNARNMIVHNGGDAVRVLPLSEIDPSKEEGGLYDMSFVKNYPQFVTGNGTWAEVTISEQQLTLAIESSVRLVKYAAEGLQEREAEKAKGRKKTAQPTQ
jgi:hypothetical protein